MVKSFNITSTSNILISIFPEYMRKVVGNAGQKGDPGDRVEDESTVRTLGDEQLQMRISRADLHGAFIKIVRSTNKKMVGLEGKDHRTKSGFFHRYLPFTNRCICRSL